MQGSVDLRPRGVDTAAHAKLFVAAGHHTVPAQVTGRW